MCLKHHADSIFFRLYSHFIHQLQVYLKRRKEKENKIRHEFDGIDTFLINFFSLNNIRVMIRRNPSDLHIYLLFLNITLLVMSHRR